MAAVSGRGIAVFSRLLASSARPAALPSRAAVLQRRRLYSSDNGSRGRSNPLIGDLDPRSPGPSRGHSPSDAGLPPPPPPPPRADALSSIPSWTREPESVASGHAYNAVSNSKINKLDIDSIIGTKTSDFAAQNSLTVASPMNQPKVRTKAVSGRTVFIKHYTSPTTAPNPVVAVRVLDKLCRVQKVKSKYHSQKFHERPGLKKKRLKSSRWRARFKQGFQATVSRVIELKRQGW